jgi:hypothetical protein
MPFEVIAPATERSTENYFGAHELELRFRPFPGVVGVHPLIPAGGFFAREIPDEDSSRTPTPVAVLTSGVRERFDPPG